jgi:peptide/nickel transport system substrate-binding protein
MRMSFTRLHRALALGAIAIVAALPPSGTASFAKEFKWAFSGDVHTLDPHGLAEIYTLGFQGNFYEPLVRRNAKLELEPALAISWEQKNENTWRFRLREAVRFHNGNPFTADDVIFSYERASSEASDVKAKLQSIQAMRKLDDFTVEITTNGPSPLLLGELSDFYIMDKEWSEANDSVRPSDVRKGAANFATWNANGTGPFKVETWQADVKTVFVVNKNWWDKPEHNLTRAVYTPIASDEARVAALLSGELDMVYPVPLQYAARVEKNPHTKLLQGPELRVIYIGFDMHRDELLYSKVTGKNPFKDWRVRKAFYLAIDAQVIADDIHGQANAHEITEGAAKPIGTIMTPGIEGYHPPLGDREPADPERAKRLLAEAGYPDGFEVTFDCPNDRYTHDEEVCLAVADILARIGVKVNVNAMTKKQYFAKILKRDTSMYLMGWTPPTYDAHNILYDALGTPDDSGQGKWNMGNYSNPEVDALQKKIAVTVDQDLRREMIRKAFEIIKEDVAIVPLHQQALSWGVRSNVSVVQRPDERFKLRSVRVN